MRRILRQMLIGPRLAGGGGAAPAWQTEAAAWEAAVIANSGTVSAGTKTAVQNFLEDLHIAELRDKILRLNLFCGDQLAAALVPVIRDVGNAGADTNTRFVADDYSEAAYGLNLNPDSGSSTFKDLDTGLNLFTAFGTTASFSMGFWASNNPDDDVTNAQLGAWETNSIVARLYGYLSGYRMADMWLSSGGQRIQYGPGQVNKVGLLSASRVSATDYRLYEDGSQVGATGTASYSATAPNATLHVFRYPAANVFEDQNCNQASYGYFVGSGLTNDDMANLHNVWAAFNTALGRS